MIADAERVEQAEVERRTTAFASACRERGLANTHQRSVIFRALASSCAHPTAEELYETVRVEIPTISLGTIYKSLTTFRAEGLVATVACGDAAIRFDARTERHHHTVCRSCGSVRDVDADALGGLRLPRGQGDGFRVDSYDLLFRGLCSRCHRTTAGRRDRA